MNRTIKLCCIFILTFTAFVTFDRSNVLKESSRITNFHQQEAKDDDEKDRRPIDIFYHVYLPPDDSEGIERSYGIIEEQLGQIGDETTSGVFGRDDVTFNYITIGQTFNQTFIDLLCEKHKLKCTHVRHEEKGFEMLTEQIILDFCKHERNDSHIVTYLHSKGALHPDQSQDVSRRFITMSAVSDKCMSRLSTNECNVCGNFRSLWGPTYWGNMWSAQCSYVKKLISPYEVEQKFELAVQTLPEEVEMKLYDEKILRFSLGRDRYAAEQFVSTHPDLIPCTMNWSEDPDGDFEKFVIQSGNIMTLLQSMTEDKNPDHLKEWYLLPGILWRYYVLYNELPSSDSWIWRHYPDGVSWKIAIQQMGFPEALYHRIRTET